MTRLSRHIALLCAATFVVATVGLPVALVYCSMQQTVTSDACCCTHDAPVTGMRIRAASCMTVTDIGRPLTAAYERVAAFGVTPVAPLCSVIIAAPPASEAFALVPVPDDSSPQSDRSHVVL